MVFQKSLTRELTFTALGVFVVLLAIIVSTQAINMLGRASEGRVATEAISALIGFWTLGFFPVLMILTVFTSTLLVLNRLWRDHEMVVWLSSGLSLRSCIRPVMWFALPLSLLVAGVTLFVGPWADQRSQDYAEIIKRREEISAIAPGIFKEAGASSNIVYFIERYSGLNGAANNLFVQDKSESKTATILAKTGFFSTGKDGERLIVLENGVRYTGTPGMADYEVANFQRLTINLSDTLPPNLGQADNRQALSLTQLLEGNSAEHRAELAWRLSLPVSCLILALLAIPLSYQKPRSGQAYYLLLAILIFFFYQNGLTVSRNWVAQETFGVWIVGMVHLCVLMLALLLLKYRNRPSRPFIQALAHLFRKPQA